MEAGLLYNVLCRYKQAITDLLTKNEQILSQAFRISGTVPGNIFSTLKYKISLEMSAILSQYIKVVYICETVSDSLRLLADSPFERDSVVNPFLASSPEERIKEDDSEIDSTTVEGTVIECNSQQESGSECQVDAKPHLIFIDCSTQTEAEVPETLISVDCCTQTEPEVQQEDLIHLSLDVEAEVKIFESSPTSSDLSSSILTNQVATFTTDSKCEDKKTSKNKVPKQVTFKSEPEITLIEKTPIESKHVSFKTQPIKETAVEKLRRMPQYDWRKKAAKVFENKNLRKVVKPQRYDKKEKGCVSNNYEILEEELFVNQLVTFSHVVSPREFYVRTDQELFQRMESTLNDDLNIMYQYVINNYHTKADAKFYLGNFCFGFIRDRRKWYRMEVVDWMMNEPNLILVHLIDYGETLNWDFKNLKSMTELYAMVPRMAFRCHFAGIYYDGRKWVKEAVQCLKELSEMKKMTKFIVIFVHREGNSHAVDLQKQNEDVDTVGMTLVRRGYAYEVKLSAKDFLQNLVEDDLEFDNLNEAITGYDAKDEARICPYTNKKGNCFKGPKCRLEHGFLSKDGVTTDKVLTMTKPFSEVVVPEYGEKVRVLITGYIDTCHFYAHLLTGRGESLYNDDFQNLKEAMKASHLVETYERFKVYPGMGELVLCKDGPEWFRGKCVGYAGADAVEVFYVDFGCEKRIKMKDLRQMKEDFLHVPFQAVECILSNCKQKEGVPEEMAVKFFNDCMHLKTFTGVVVESSQPLVLCLWDRSDIEMSYVLKQCQLAQDKVDNSLPAKDSILYCG